MLSGYSLGDNTGKLSQDMAGYAMSIKISIEKPRQQINCCLGFDFVMLFIREQQLITIQLSRSGYSQLWLVYNGLDNNPRYNLQNYQKSS